jgi:hypothetical protein
MKVSDFIALSAAVFALLYVVVRIYDETQRQPRAPTVEQEQDSCREVVACIGQHHPTVEEVLDEYDAPQWALIERIHQANTAGM